MKRLILLMALVTLVAGMTGCRNRMFGRRGARCRPEPPAVQMQMPLQQPGCGPTCGQPGAQVIVPQGAVITEGAPTVTEGFQTGPIVGSGETIVDRQIITVPGPEAAPLPHSGS